MRGKSSGLQRAWRAVPAMLATAVLVCAPAQGTSAQQQLRVNATIPRHASIRMNPPTTLTISEADIARGYVDVPTPVEVDVRSNVREGYTLAFECRCVQVRRAYVHGLDAALTVVGGASALAARRAAGPGVWHDQLVLRLRFDLAADARPGEHAWPLDISMMSQ